MNHILVDVVGYRAILIIIYSCTRYVYENAVTAYISTYKLFVYISTTPARLEYIPKLITYYFCYHFIHTFGNISLNIS